MDRSTVAAVTAPSDGSRNFRKHKRSYRLFGRHRRKKLKKRAIKVLIASAVFVLLVVVAYTIVKMTLSEGSSPTPIFRSE
jgi:hypothetical protein